MRCSLVSHFDYCRFLNCILECCQIQHQEDFTTCFISSCVFLLTFYSSSSYILINFEWILAFFVKYWQLSPEPWTHQANALPWSCIPSWMNVHIHLFICRCQKTVWGAGSFLLPYGLMKSSSNCLPWHWCLYSLSHFIGILFYVWVLQFNKTQ